jgi:hypothetical protein
MLAVVAGAALPLGTLVAGGFRNPIELGAAFAMGAVSLAVPGYYLADDAQQRYRLTLEWVPVARRTGR